MRVGTASLSFVAAGVAAIAAFHAPRTAVALSSGDRAELETAAAPAGLFAGSADLEMRFVQEDGPDSGHVRVVLVPDTRILTILEARSAAQQAFLKALDEPGLGGDLRRVTVVVQLAPDSSPEVAEQVIRFVHKGGREWSVLPGVE